MKPVTLEERLLNTVRTIEDDRNTWLVHWSDLRDYMLPRHGRGLNGKTASETNNGEKKHTKIYDGSHLRALNDLAGGMQSGLTSPSRPWFKLSLGDPAMDDNPVLALWLDDVSNRIYRALQSSNMYTVFHQCYKELGAFGTVAASLEEDPVTQIRGRTFTIGEYGLGLDTEGRTNIFQRGAYRNVRQLATMFGDEFVESRKTLKEARQRGDERSRFRVDQLIMPADPEIEGIMSTKMDYAGIWLFSGESPLRGRNPAAPEIVQVGGYKEFPILAARWEVIADNTYGESPCMDVLPDVKSVQLESKVLLAMLEKAANPPVVAPGDLRGTQINSMPGGVTFSDALVNGGQGGLRPLYEVRPDTAALAERINHQLLSIREGLFSDLFRMLQMAGSSRMTATEVAERQQEKLLLLGPVIERVHNELLGPAIRRIFNILLRRGEIPPPPDEAIIGQPLEIVYVSILAQAQRMVGVANTEQFLSFVGNLSAVNPGVLDNVDFDAAVRDHASRLGVTPKIVRSADEVAAMREARAAQDQINSALPAMGAAAESAKVLSETEMGGNTALNALMAGMQ